MTIKGKQVRSEAVSLLLQIDRDKVTKVILKSQRVK